MSVTALFGYAIPAGDAAQDDDPAAALERAREDGPPAGYAFKGSVTPVEAWSLVVAGLAKLVDVRTAEEHRFVGHVPGSQHVPWMTGLSLVRNPRFLGDMQRHVKKTDAILLLCRSGKRSAAAADALTKAGFSQVFNVAEGFEGDIDANRRRGSRGGWRSYDLPWVQD